MRAKSACLILAFGLLIGPLARGEEPAHHTVSWYREHPDTREKVNKLCMDNPGEAQHSPDCLNALAASDDAARDRLMSINPPRIDCATQPRMWQISNHCGPLGAGH